MAERVVLHIGTMKSGTSFVQSALVANPEVLDAAGARYLGGRFGRQTKAVRDVHARPRHPDEHHRWQGLVEELRQFEGDVGLISMEFLSFARGVELEALLAPLAGLHVEVVLTVRDQFRAIPAQWQTYTRNLGTDSWESYLRHIEASAGRGIRRSKAAFTFHRAQDVVRILDRWSAHPQVDRVTVVTLPPPSAPREELWDRFCRAARISAPEATLSGLHENTSLGYASCDVLRRLNAHLSDVRPPVYRKAMRPLARAALTPLTADEGRPGLDSRGADLAGRLNQRIRDGVERGGYDLVGSLDELPVQDGTTAPDRPVPPVPGEVDRAVEAIRAYAAGSGDGAPDAPTGARKRRSHDLDARVEEAARLLRSAEGWGL